MWLIFSFTSGCTRRGFSQGWVEPRARVGTGWWGGSGHPSLRPGSYFPPDWGTQSSMSHLPPSVTASSLPVLTSLPHPHLKRMLIEWKMAAFPKEMKYLPFPRNLPFLWEEWVYTQKETAENPEDNISTFKQQQCWGLTSGESLAKRVKWF